MVSLPTASPAWRSSVLLMYVIIFINLQIDMGVKKGMYNGVQAT